MDNIIDTFNINKEIINKDDLLKLNDYNDDNNDDNDEKIDIILETENKYRDAGVTAVPTFIINDDYVVPGAQTKEFWLEVFEEVFQKNGRNYI